MTADDLKRVDTLLLVNLCARDKGDELAWSEFLRRFAPGIKSIITSTLRRCTGNSVLLEKTSVRFRIDQRTDLFQDVMLRLVEHDCAVLKAFRGSGEDEFIAYLAITACSVVRDSVRRVRALKRPLESILESTAASGSRSSCEARESLSSAERQVLAQELWRLGMLTLRNLSGSFYQRDRAVFELYFVKGLSANEIARLQPIGLSKTAVENILNRLKDRIRQIADSCPRANEKK